MICPVNDRVEEVIFSKNIKSEVIEVSGYTYSLADGKRHS